MAVQIRTSGDFESLAHDVRAVSIQRLSAFAERYGARFTDVELHAHLKKLGEHENAANECKLNFHTDKGRFHVAEEAFGSEPALREALLTLRGRLEKHFEQNPVSAETLTH